jgi:hypothetical protein
MFEGGFYCDWRFPCRHKKVLDKSVVLWWMRRYRYYLLSTCFDSKHFGRKKHRNEEKIESAAFGSVRFADNGFCCPAHFDVCNCC